MVLPDTNVLILSLAGKAPDASVFEKLITQNKLAFSPITIAEFLARADKRDQKLLERLIKHFPVFHIDTTTAKIAADYRKQFSRKKKTVYLLDCFVAAACKQHNAALLTNDTKDFPMKDIKITTP